MDPAGIRASRLVAIKEDEITELEFTYEGWFFMLFKYHAQLARTYDLVTKENIYNISWVDQEGPKHHRGTSGSIGAIRYMVENASEPINLT